MRLKYNSEILFLFYYLRFQVHTFCWHLDFAKLRKPFIWTPWTLYSRMFSVHATLHSSCLWSISMTFNDGNRNYYKTLFHPYSTILYNRFLLKTTCVFTSFRSWPVAKWKLLEDSIPSLSCLIIELPQLKLCRKSTLWNWTYLVLFLKFKNGQIRNLQSFCLTLRDSLWTVLIVLTWISYAYCSNFWGTPGTPTRYLQK